MLYDQFSYLLERLTRHTNRHGETILTRHLEAAILEASETGNRDDFNALTGAVAGLLRRASQGAA